MSVQCWEFKDPAADKLAEDTGLGHGLTVGSHTILLADDDADIRDMLRLVLEKAGYNVVTAMDGGEASAVLLSTPVDAVVTDLIMPKKDGMQLLMELRKTHPKVRVVVMTGGGHIASEEYLKFARAFGAHAVLPKPFTHDQLLEALASLLPPKKS